MTFTSKNVINVDIASEFANTPADPLSFAANEIVKQAGSQSFNNYARMELKKTVAHFRETSINHPIYSTLSGNKELIKKVLTNNTTGRLRKVQQDINSRVNSITNTSADFSASASVPFVIASTDNYAKISKGNNSLSMQNAFMPDKNRVITSDNPIDNLGGEISNKSSDIQDSNIEFTSGRLR